jgi:DNA-directed RNA polymerase specialized sigma24 family protein
VATAEDVALSAFYNFLEQAGADMLLGAESSPELAAEMVYESRRLLGLWPDATLRSVALWKMEGCSNREFAARLGCVESTVERKLRAIRNSCSGRASS